MRVTREWLGIVLVAVAAGSSAAAAQATAAVVRPGDRIALVARDTVDTLPIGADGRVVLPFVGPVAVVGLSPKAVEDSVVRSMARVLTRPDLRATVLRRVIVDGAVRNSGVLYLDETMGLAAAIALTGGVSEEGNVRRIELWRDGRLVGRFATQQLASVAPSLASGDHVWVARSSWAARNAFVVASLASTLASLIIFLVSR